MTRTNDATQEEAKAAFDYNATTGILRWRHRPEMSNSWNARFAGATAGSDNGAGYLRVKFGARRYLVHQIAFLIEHGYIPEEIDHKDQVRHHNWIDNLRDVTRLENAKNHTLQSNNTSGHVGVYWNKQRDMWRAYVYIGSRQKHLGHFDDFDDAVACRAAANENLDFHDNHGRKVA